MRQTACLRDGPDCQNVLHNRVSMDEYNAWADRHRLVRVRIDEIFLTRMLNPRGAPPYGVLREVESSLPHDARVVHVITDTASPSLIAFVQSSEFDVVPMGHEVPLFDPKMTEREVPA